MLEVHKTAEMIQALAAQQKLTLIARHFAVAKARATTG